MYNESQDGYIPSAAKRKPIETAKCPKCGDPDYIDAGNAKLCLNCGYEEKHYEDESSR